MSRDPRFPPFDGRQAAARLGRFWDELIGGGGQEAEDAPDLTGLTDAVRRLHAAPRVEAPAAAHEGLRALVAAHPEWAETLASAPVRVAPGRQATNGRTPRPAVVPVAPRPRPLRRGWPVIEFAVLTAAILMLAFVAYNMNQTADQPDPTSVATPVASPTVAPATPTAPPAGAVGDWPMLGGGPSRTGGADRAIPAAAPEQRWSVSVAPGIRGIVAAGDKVYVTDGGTLYALDFATGAQRWTFPLGVEPAPTAAHSPAVAGGVVYVAASDGTVYAIDAGNGTEHWQTPLGEPVKTAVAVADGLVFVGTAPDETGSLYALDAASGEERWQASTGPINVSSPVVADGVVFVGAGGRTVHAIDVSNGASLWMEEVGAGMKSVAVGGGIAVVGSRSTGSFQNFVALDAATGDLEWNIGVISELPPAIVGDTVYVTDNGVGVAAHNAGSGSQRWQFSATLKIVETLVAGDALLVCRTDGTLIAVSAAGGDERWRLPTGTDATGAAVGAGVIYVAHKDGTVAAYG